MKRETPTVYLLAALLVSGANAQVGHSPAESLERWGQPASGQIDTNGCGTLQFSSGPFAVALTFISGTVQQAVYRAAPLDEDGINRILGMNSDGVTWDPLVLPGRSPDANGNRKWMRVDEMAMAEISSNAVTVLGPGWYPRLACPTPPESTNDAITVTQAVVQATAQEAPAVLRSMPGVLPDDIVGFWRGDIPGWATVVLEIRNGGGVNWIVLGKDKRQEWKARWTRQSEDGQVEYTFAEEVPTTGDLLPAFGSCEPPSRGRLRFTAAQLSPNVPAAFRPWEMASRMDFERIASMPQWKPGAPADLPVKGDSKEDALRLLGRPTGSMVSGGREALLYPWGKVWLVNGKVCGVE